MKREEVTSTFDCMYINKVGNCYNEYVLPLKYTAKLYSKKVGTIAFTKDLFLAVSLTITGISIILIL